MHGSLDSFTLGYCEISRFWFRFEYSTIQHLFRLKREEEYGRADEMGSKSLRIGHKNKGGQNESLSSSSK